MYISENLCHYPKWQVSQAGINNCIPHNNVDAATYPCLRWTYTWIWYDSSCFDTANSFYSFHEINLSMFLKVGCFVATWHGCPTAREEIANNPGKRNRHETTLKHDKSRAEYIFLGIRCTLIVTATCVYGAGPFQQYAPGKLHWYCGQDMNGQPSAWIAAVTHSWCMLNHVASATMVLQACLEHCLMAVEECVYYIVCDMVHVALWS